jgi:outer membrane protein OmpA-like peptidoglycan-associated protein
MNRFYCFAGFFLISFLSISQNLDKVYNRALDSFYSEEFESALELFNFVIENDPNFEDVLYRAELCSLLTMNRYTSLDKYLGFKEEMVKKDKFYHYWAGRVYMAKYQFSDASESLKIFLRGRGSKSKEVIDEARTWVKWSIEAQKLLDNPKFFEIHLLEKGVNTEYAEMSPVFFPMKEELLFMSNRDASNPNDFQVYHTIHEANRKWSKPTQVPDLGTFTRDNANIELVDEDGRLFQFRKHKGGDLYYSEPTDTRTGWSEPVEFDSEITSTHLGSHFFINEHEDRIIFSKNVGSKKSENLDLFQSFKNHETGKWTKPALFATNINSEFNEDSPYLSPDEKTLYFASDGHHSLGGYDIFKSTFDSASLTWSEPINLGFPMNSPDDETHFKLNTDQTSGYFVSNRLNTLGDFDIFFFWELHTVKIKGRVIQQEGENILEDARIYFRPDLYRDMYFFSEISPDGTYITEIPSDDIFYVEIRGKDEIVYLQEFEIHDTGGASTTYLKNFHTKDGFDDPLIIKREKVIPLESEALGSNVIAEKQKKEGDKIEDGVSVPSNIKENVIESSSNTRSQETARDRADNKTLSPLLNEGSKVALRTIYFEFGNVKLSSKSDQILTSIARLLNENPNMTIEIAGHTDSVGDADTNQWVSQARANAVMQWLLKNGISKERMIAKGYGESVPLASNDDEKEGREFNRRIEIIRN